MRVLKRLLHDDRGQGLLEYGMIILLIAIVCVASLNYLGQKNNNGLNNSASTLNNAM